MGDVCSYDPEGLIDGLHGLNIQLIVVAAQIVSHLLSQSLKNLALLWRADLAWLQPKQSLDDGQFLYLDFKLGRKHLQKVYGVNFGERQSCEDRPQTLEHCQLDCLIAVEFLDLGLE